MTLSAMTTTDTHCPYCSLQCGMRLRTAPSGAAVPVEVVERPGFPVNLGALCGKGAAPQRCSTGSPG